MSRIAIIGAGLAGASCAYILSAGEHNVQVYDSAAKPASKASGNILGLYNPRFFAEDCTEGRFYRDAFYAALKLFEALPDCDWSPIGALHLITNDQKDKRYHKMIDHGLWRGEDMSILSAKDASRLAGCDIGYDALYLPRAGSISPQKLCRAYLRNIDVRYDQAVQDFDQIDADYIIIACGMQSIDFHEASHLPLRPVRGQVSYIHGMKTKPSCVLCYGGYAAPMDGDHLIAGSSFDRGIDDPVIKVEDDRNNLQKLYDAVPCLFDSIAEAKITGQRAGIRCAAPGHMPVIGALSDRVLISTAHGSHGILSSIGGAHLLRDMIDGRPVDHSLVKALSPARFE